MILEKKKAEQDYSEEFRSAFEDHLREVNNLGVRAGGILIVILTPFFSILDKVVVPDYFLPLLYIRIFMLFCSLIISILTFSHFGKKYTFALSIALVLMAALCIVVMVHLHEGYRSEYYAGIMLVILGAGVLMKWRVKWSSSTYSLIYLSYLVPCLLGEVKEVEILISNSTFLLSMILVVIVTQYSSLRLLYCEFHSSLHLKETKASLEEAYNKLRKVDRLKSQFFSNITHELRTHLTLILSPLEGILEGVTGNFDRDQQEYFKPIWKNAIKAAEVDQRPAGSDRTGRSLHAHSH